MTIFRIHEYKAALSIKMHGKAEKTNFKMNSNPFCEFSLQPIMILVVIMQISETSYFMYEYE
jgi:hypothetical protein